MNDSPSRGPTRGRKLLRSLPFAAAALLLLSSACSTGRKVSGASLRERSPDFLMRQMISNQVDAEWMEARAKVDFDDGNLAIGATATIRLRRDSAMWVSVRKLGFEVGRALIRPDSFFVLDRINNEYLAKDLNYFARLYSLPADFQILQAIVLGNPFFFMTTGYRTEQVNQQYHLFGRRGAMESHYWIKPDGYHLQQMAFDDQDQRRQVKIDLEEYGQRSEDQKFSYLRNLELTSADTGKVIIGIRFSQVEFNVPKNIRFEVPERYTRID